MKRILNLWLLAILLGGMSMSVTSCKDDDSSEPNVDEKEIEALEQQAKADVFWSVVNHLTGYEAITADYEGKTFEATIGEPSDENTLHRIVATNDMISAAERFNQLIGEERVDENTTQYTWQNDTVGTLTYRKCTDGKAWATVDVSIRQLPGLERLIYRSSDQSDDNGDGDFKGTAYYRFGDIVTKKRKDGETDYWICVRPAFGPEGKGKSHWVSVTPTPLPKNNVWHYKGSNGIQYALPTGLGDNQLHAQNLAEMLYAICNPQAWENNIKQNLDNKKMRMFNDFRKDRIKYHDRFFWQRVQDNWEELRFFKEIFGVSKDELNKMLTSADGLNLLTNGYTWKWWLVGHNSPILYRHRFTTAASGIESNMHKGGKMEEVKNEVIKSKINLNVEDPQQFLYYWVNEKFFGTKAPHYIIRHATGAELASNGKADPQEPIKGVDPYWVYNVYYGYTDRKLSEVSPETFDEAGNPTNDSGYKNRAYYCQGDIVQDANGNKWVCVQPSAYGDANLFKEQPYSYFISFEKKPILDPALMYGIPKSKELAAQMLFSLEILYQNYASHIANEDAYACQMAKNIRDHLGVELSELLAKRGVLHKFSKAEKEKLTPCSFGSTVYYDGDDICVLRLVGDYTVEQADGGEDIAYRFYTNYSNSTDKMLLKHLADVECVEKYKADKWVSYPWYIIETNQTSDKNVGPRNDKGTDRLEDLLYSRGYLAVKGKTKTNMYREPLLVFAVKRVRDSGVKATRFEDGVAFTELNMMKAVDKEDYEADIPSVTDKISGTYKEYSPGRIFLEEKSWKFGMANSISGF